MFCGECGTKNETGSNFCENCGAKLENKKKNPMFSKNCKWCYSCYYNCFHYIK